MTWPSSCDCSSVAFGKRTRVTWMSLYEAEISNPYLPQMPPLHTSMVLVNPNQIVFGLV